MTVFQRQNLKRVISVVVIFSVLLEILLPLQEARAGWFEDLMGKFTKVLPLPDNLDYENNGNITFGTWFKFCPFTTSAGCNDPDCVKADKCENDNDCKNQITCKNSEIRFCSKGGVCACAGCNDEENFEVRLNGTIEIDGQKVSNYICKNKKKPSETACPIVNESLECAKRNKFPPVTLPNGQADTECYKCSNVLNAIQTSDSSHKTVIFDEATQSYKLPNYILPAECELKMLEGPTGETESKKEERLAKARSCLELEQLQREAGQAVFSAKKLYNATDPFSSCQFLGTCKTSCFLKFGEMSYTITLVDVLKSITPTGYLLWAQRIYSIVKVIQKAKSLVDTAKSFYKAVDTLVNKLGELVYNTKALYDSFKKIGLKWSDPGSGLIGIIDGFASGLESFGIAKSESLSTIDAIGQNLRNNIKADLMTKDSVSFLFSDNQNRAKLNEALTPLFLSLKSINTILDEVIKNTLTVPARQYKQQECAGNPPGPMNLGDQCLNCFTCRTYDAYQLQPGTGYALYSDRCKNLHSEYPHFCPVVKHSIKDYAGWDYICNPLFNPNTEEDIKSRYEAYFQTGNVVKLQDLTDEGKELVLERHAGEPDPDYQSEVVPIKVPYNYQINPPRDEVFCSMPSRVNPRFQTTGPAQAGDTRNWLEIYQTAAGKIMRLKNGLANIANDIKDYNYSPFRFTGSLAVINNNIYLSQKLIYDIKNEIRVLSLTNLKLKGDFENRCKYKMKDCAKYPCSIEEQACSGTPYWQEYGWYETTFPTGDPIPKDACLNTWKAVYGPDAAKNGYQSDLMQVDWETQIENLSASAINLEQMIDGLPSCLGTPCLSPNDAAIIFWLNGAKNNVGSLTNTFISGLKKEICPAGAYNNCLDYCNGDNYKKTYSSCRTACSRFSPASGAVNACRDYCKDKCDGNSSCSVSRCKNACGNGNSACPKDPFAKYNLEANLKSFLDSLTAISDRFLAIQNAWNQQSPGSPPEPDGRPRAELDVAETYAWRVKKTIELSKEIIGFLSAAKSSWEQLRSAYYDLKGNSSIKNLTNAWGVLFEGEGKMDIIEKVEKTVGKGYACDAKAEGFLPKIKCFEETIGKKFGKANDNDPDGLYEFFVKISKIEDMLFNLDGPTVTIKDKVYTSMKNLVYGLEPMIDMDKKTNDSDYLSKLADNPISYLDESFTKIDSQIKQNGSWLGDIAKGLNSFFHDAYQEPIKLAGEHTATLNRLVFGEDDLRQACNGLNVVLEQNPEDFKTACLAVKTNLTSDSKLNGLCTNFSVFGASLGSKTELVNEISKLNKQWNSPPESDPKKKPCKDVDGSDSRWPGCQIVKIKKDNLESIKCLKCQCGENSCECSNSETNCKNLSDEEYANFGRQCSYLANQKETEKACGQFGILSAALQNKCSDINTPFSSFCADQACSDNEGCVKYCRDKIKVGDQEINGSGRCNNLKDGIGKICDKNYQAGCPDSGLPNLLGDDQAVLREKLKNVCSTKITDIKSNLDKVMRAFSIVIGIKSFTAIAQPDIKLSWKKGVEFNGFQGPKDLWADTKKTIEEAYNLKDSLLNIKKDLKSAYNSKMPDDALDAKGGFKFNPPTCEKEPANSYSAITKVTKTGPNGGPVCPDADEYFQLLDAHFSQIRQHLYQIDLERKNMKRLRLGPLSLDIIRTAPNVFPQVSEVYNTASDLKQKAQLLWALGNAVDFAQKNCTCGQSVCDICLYEKDNGAGEKVCWAPLCVSGVPLTPTPFTQPFCYVTYIMREPMKSMAESLENQLLGK